MSDAQRLWVVLLPALAFFDFALHRGLFGLYPTDLSLSRAWMDTTHAWPLWARTGLIMLLGWVLYLHLYSDHAPL